MLSLYGWALIQTLTWHVLQHGVRYVHFHVFFHLSGDAFRGGGFASSALDECSDRCHKGVGGDYLSTNFVGSIPGAEIGRDMPVKSLINHVSAYNIE